MEQNLWTQCHGPKQVIPFQETAWRMVEAQHIFGTRKLVDSAGEQEILEELIEAQKPKYFGREFIGLHYLLYTPFCYPPLTYGSRFGNRNERSLWYGALQLSTVFTEKAFYQFVFLQASQAAFGNVLRTFTAFSTPIKTERGIHLIKPPFEKHIEHISSPTQYDTSQALGTAMRGANIEAFYYQSARDPDKGVNIGLFSPAAFLHKKPNAGSFQTWECIANNDTIEFMRTSALENEYRVFSIKTFLVDDKLPCPAN